MSSEEPTTFDALLRRYRVAPQLGLTHLAERAELGSRAGATQERGVHLLPSAATVEMLTDP